MFTDNTDNAFLTEDLHLEHLFMEPLETNAPVPLETNAPVPIEPNEPVPIDMDDTTWFFAGVNLGEVVPENVFDFQNFQPLPIVVPDNVVDFHPPQPVPIVVTGTRLAPAKKNPPVVARVKRQTKHKGNSPNMVPTQVLRPPMDDTNARLAHLEAQLMEKNHEIEDKKVTILKLQRAVQGLHADIHALNAQVHYLRNANVGK